VKISDYNRCVDECADDVYRFILKNMRVEDSARDVVQDAFLKMWEKRKTIQADKARSYLFSTAYHRMIDVIRREKKLQYKDVLPSTSHASNVNAHDLVTVLDQALNTLPDIQKSVVLLRDYEGYSYEEIGSICNLKPSQVKVYIYRARLSLKKYIGKVEVLI
jgi:RNA polymerase sigma-70 factor (ECF subfamily)